MKPCFCHRTPPQNPTPLHPFNGAVKNKASFVSWPCACGRFIHFISIPFRRSVHSASLHSSTLSFTTFRLRSFHQPQHRTAKTNSFSTFRKAIYTQAFRCHGFAYPSLRWLLCFAKVTKAANASKQTAHATQATNPVCSIPFSHCICFL